MPNLFNILLCLCFQLTASDQTRVVIDDVQINYSGTYMCEVTVLPTFKALIQFANMTVVGKLLLLLNMHLLSCYKFVFLCKLLLLLSNVVYAWIDASIIFFVAIKDFQQKNHICIVVYFLYKFHFIYLAKRKNHTFSKNSYLHLYQTYRLCCCSLSQSTVCHHPLANAHSIYHTIWNHRKWIIYLVWPLDACNLNWPIIILLYLVNLNM